MSVVLEPGAERARRRGQARRGYAQPAVPVPQGTENPGVPAPPMGHKGTRVVRRAKALSWKSPEAFAVLIASFVVSMACFYVAAYARVTAEGFEKAQLNKRLRATRLEREQLEADLSKLTRSERVEQRAAALGLIPSPASALNLLGISGENTVVAPITSNTVPRIEAPQ